MISTSQLEHVLQQTFGNLPVMKGEAVTCYLISRASVPTLETIVFTAGPAEKEEAVAVFSDPAAAQLYVAKAGLDAEYTVATLEPIPLLRWLLQAHDEGVRYLAIDPN